MSGKTKNQAGYMLLAVMLMMSVMLLALSIELPRIAQEIKREKEQELVNRGKEYATAIKRFYRKNGTYPVSLDQLESTNGLRYLRKRYKDPMTESGEFKLVHLGEAQINLTSAAGINNGQNNGSGGNPNNATPGSGSTTAGSPAGTSSPGINSGSSGFGSANSSGFGSTGSSSFGSGSNSGLGSSGLGSGGLGSSGLGSGSQPAAGATGTPGTQAVNQPGTGQMGSLTTQNLGNGMAVQGGGPIIGVVSTSKKTSIKEFNSNNEYDEWLFVYDPRGDQAGNGGVMVASPIGSATGSGNSSGIPQPVQPVRTSTPSTPQ